MTIFMDEVGELRLDLQPKLLRALETRQLRHVGGNLREHCAGLATYSPAIRAYDGCGRH